MKCTGINRKYGKLKNTESVELSKEKQLTIKNMRKILAL